MDYYQDIIVTAVDRLGRLSIPTSYRRVLKNRSGSDEEVIIGRHPALKCLIGYDLQRFADINADLNRPYEGGYDEERELEREERSSRLTAHTKRLKIEAPGRIILPPSLQLASGIAEQAVFVAASATFQIWSMAGARSREDKLPGINQAIDDQLAAKGARG